MSWMRSAHRGRPPAGNSPRGSHRHGYEMVLAAQGPTATHRRGGAQGRAPEVATVPSLLGRRGRFRRPDPATRAERWMISYSEGRWPTTRRCTASAEHHFKEGRVTSPVRGAEGGCRARAPGGGRAARAQDWPSAPGVAAGRGCFLPTRRRKTRARLRMRTTFNGRKENLLILSRPRGAGRVEGRTTVIPSLNSQARSGYRGSS